VLKNQCATKVIGLVARAYENVAVGF
jgi:hypothetical protein